MSSVVSFRFKSAMMFDTIRFDGDTIGVAKLKKEIIARKKLCTTNGGVCYFDLRLFNADTNEEFFDGGLVPKNTLVLVTRLPKPGRPFRRPPLRTAVSAPDNKSHRPVIPESTTEESRLSAVVNMRVEDILPAKSGRCSRSPLPPGSLPPPGYVCHRCGIAGHYIQHCPTNSQRVLSYRGIPGFLRGPSSEFVMKPNEGIFQSALKSTLFCKGVMDTCDDSLKCPVCHNLVVDAVELSCCHDSLCSNCAWDKLLQTDMHCPLCNQTVTAQDVIPNRALRQLVEETKKEMLSKYVETTFSNSMGKCKGSIPGDHNTELLPSPPSSLNSAQQNTPPITQDSSQNTPPGTPPNTPPHQATPPSSPHQSMNEPIVKYKDDPAGVASVIDAKNMKVEVQTLKLEEPGNVLDAAKPVYGLPVAKGESTPVVKLESPSFSSTICPITSSHKFSSHPVYNIPKQIETSLQQSAQPPFCQGLIITSASSVLPQLSPSINTSAKPLETRQPFPSLPPSPARSRPLPSWLVSKVPSSPQVAGVKREASDLKSSHKPSKIPRPDTTRTTCTKYLP